MTNARIFYPHYGGKCRVCGGRYSRYTPCVWLDGWIAHAECPNGGEAV